MFFNIKYYFDTQAYSEPCQTSNMECFAKIVKEFQPLTIFTKILVLGCLAMF